MALYFSSGLLTVYSIWAAVNSFDRISKMVAMNQLVIRGNEFEIVNFHMSNFVQYAFFAVILFSLGRIFQITSTGTVAKVDATSLSTETEEDANTDDFQDWFQNEGKL